MNSLGRILIADDEAAPRRLLKASLERAGYEVVTVESGRSALAVLQEQRFDLLVLDFEMPDLDGSKVCLSLRASPETVDLPVLVLTGHTDENDEIICLQAGANDFVTKPVSVPLLTARIQTQLRLQALRSEMKTRNAELERWRGAHEADLDAARLIQRAIIPLEPPELTGWSVQVSYKPLIQVGGDIYGWRKLPDNRCLFWIADATGHGVAAALYTTLAALLFEQALDQAESPAAVLEKVNEQFFAVFKGKGFITAGALMLHKDGKILFAGAAHPPLLVVSRDRTLTSLESSAALIGLTSRLQAKDVLGEIAVGDSALLYTDGVYGLTGEEGRLTHHHLEKALLDQTGTEILLDEAMSYLGQRARSSDYLDDASGITITRRN